MIFDVMEAIDVLAGAIAAWIAAGVAALMAAWRGVTGAWRAEQGPEAEPDARDAHRGAQGPQKDFDYQEAA